jgi:hypothetical protein
MKKIEDNITLFVKNQFPEFYREQGNNFIDFVAEYYDWTLQTNNVGHFTRNLLNYGDIDTTIEEFLEYYKTKYLNGSVINLAQTRFEVKHASDLYTSKGSERGLKLFLNNLYNVSDVDVYRPSEDVLKASDGEWYVPVYLEVAISSKTSSFVGKQIVGSASGATAFVEGVNRKSLNGKYFDVVYLSNVSGNFQLDEIITNDGSLAQCPRIIGSLTNVTIIDSSRGFEVGDVVDISSDARGKNAKGLISNTAQSTGKVFFTLANGGTGYRLLTQPIVSEKTVLVRNITSANPLITDFLIDEYVYQPLANIAFDSSNTEFSYGQLITGANSTANVATGNIVGKTQTPITGTATANSSSAVVVGSNTSFLNQLANNDYIKFQACTASFQVLSITNGTHLTLTSSGPNVDANTVVVANGSLLVTVDTGSFADADRIAGSAALISGYTNKTAYGVVVGANGGAIGFSNVVNEFTPNGHNFIYGETSNVYANVSFVSTGTGAAFSIGSLTDEETVYLNTDRVGGNNSIATVTLTGTISANTTSPQVNGVSTLFTTELYPGAHIKFLGNTQVFQVNTISNNTILNLTTNGILRVANQYAVTNGAYLSIPLSVLKYGFPKLLTGNVSTILNLALTRDSYEIGTIASLANVNPGSSYNIDPIVQVRDAPIASFGRKDLHVETSNQVGVFIEGEEIVQSLSSNSYTLSVYGSVSSLVVGETATQVINSTSNAYGEVITSNSSLLLIKTENGFVNSAIGSALSGTVSCNSTSPQVNGAGTLFTSELASGDFIKFSSNTLVFKVDSISNNTRMSLTSNGVAISSNAYSLVSNVVVGMSSGTRFIVNTAVSNTQLAISRGSVINTGLDFINLKRKTFNQSFTANVVISGTTSGATANVTGVTQIESTQSMGNNAVVYADTSSVNGSIISMAVIDSGYAYENGETITISKPSSEYIATGYANLINQGVGEGYFKSTRGFLNDDKYIHDGDFYQSYSYQVKTSIPLEVYGETLKQLCHVAGTKLFGNIIKVSTATVTVTSATLDIII